MLFDRARAGAYREVITESDINGIKSFVSCAKSSLEALGDFYSLLSLKEQLSEETLRKAMQITLKTLQDSE